VFLFYDNFIADSPLPDFLFINWRLFYYPFSWNLLLSPFSKKCIIHCCWALSTVLISFFFRACLGWDELPLLFSLILTIIGDFII